MRLYHVTAVPDTIEREGFCDGEGSYGLVRRDEPISGVFLSDSPLDVNDGVWGDGLLLVEIDEALIADYEWIEEEKPHREWCIPAALLNAHARVTIVPS